MAATSSELASTSDFYTLEAVLPDRDRALLAEVRAFMREEVGPIINDYWTREEFPHQVFPRMAEIGMGGLALEGYGCANRGVVVDGFVAMEMAAVDCSVATGLGVHNHLAMGSIHHCGSEEQKEQWLPGMARLETIGAFGLTEPEVGSGAARGLKTTARRDGDTWILNGAKRWIGNATFADVVVIWARDEADDQVKGFLVPKDTPGFSPEKMTGKIALRAVQSAEITLTDVEVSESQRLAKANTFMDTAGILTQSRIAVAWEAVGCARGAYEVALRYAGEREQFGRPIARFQLVQDLLARMLGNIVACQSMALRLSQLAEAGQAGVQHASLAKAFCTARMRETTGWARELLAGNGILLEYDVARFVADSEAIYSYEGTREINSLIVGLAITGESAFVGK
ncbi:MAG: glutaryl-CoA dehydrogenase [Solirubrobacteraceae bacterium]|jgi:glutaryl-CoA dehydrogenase|nr:glutaryl-CoA dehydrogenase [Solirubrobacteraceae bacterium]